MTRRVALVAVAALACACAAGCTGGPHGTRARSSSSTSGVAAGSWAREKPPAGCPVTLGSAVTVPPSVIPANEAPVPWVAHWFGEGTLWTRLPPTGVLPAEPGQAGQPAWSTKFPWWRTAPGALTIQARMTGDAAAAFDADIPAGYPAIGFQPTDLHWSALGCWRVTATHAGDSLTFTVWVEALAPG